jgi:hypothetical protein
MYAQLMVLVIALLVCAASDGFLKFERWLERRDYVKHFED